MASWKTTEAVWTDASDQYMYMQSTGQSFPQPCSIISSALAAWAAGDHREWSQELTQMYVLTFTLELYTKSKLAMDERRKPTKFAGLTV